MNKRGQTTLFIILGIIIVVLVALFFVGRKTEIIPDLFPAADAQGELNDIDDHVTDCLAEIGDEYVRQIALQGGYLSVGADTYRLWNDTTVSYLCWNQEGLPTCSNRLLTEAHMEDELEEVITEALSTCINIYDYSDDLQAADDWVLEVDVNYDSVDLYLDYPVQVVKDEDSASTDGFEESLNLPLGELFDVSQYIVNQHAEWGVFDPLLYMLGQAGKYTIYTNKPYPDTLYQLKLREGDFIFQFGIQGEENV
tara:strand:+ start:1314 stop:2072 length:759 start_codon:yes stop_codon:yes gene_type:complete